MTTIHLPGAAVDLRRARRDAGLSRAQLAALTGYSMSYLANIEQGSVPKRSRVLEAAHAAIDAHNEKRPAGRPSASTTSAVGAAADVRSE